MSADEILRIIILVLLATIIFEILLPLLKIVLLIAALYFLAFVVVGHS